MIRLRDIHFGFTPSQPVLKGLNFRLAPGERVGIIGPNGAGKTTLFHLIVGLIAPHQGEIEVFGKLRCREQDFREVRQKVGLLFQDSDDQLFCPTVAEDIAFGPMNLGKTRHEADAIVRETLAKLGLQGFENRVTHQLSGGEKRLVSLATVLAMSPKVLLLDEPTNGLHEDAVQQVESILMEHASSYIIISHDRDLLSRTTTHIYQLTDGILIAIDSPSLVTFHSPASAYT